MDDAAEETTSPHVVRRALNRIEDLYLAVLRAALLLLATLLIAAAIVLTVLSLYRLSKTPDSVHEKPAVVAASELVGAAASKQQDAQSGQDPQAAQRHGYASFVARYARLFRTQFETFRHEDDKPLQQQQFDDSYVGTQERLNATKVGRVNYDSDVTDLHQLFSVMQSAASLPQTQAKLQAYKQAKKVQVCRKVEKTRTELATGWDRYSTTCSTWYMEPMGCSTVRSVEIPYTAQECRMQYPEGVESYGQIFRRYQDTFFKRLGELRRDNALEAEQKRDAISAGNAKGRGGLWTALEIGGGFLLLMFLFLLIAIERHQRRLSRTE